MIRIIEHHHKLRISALETLGDLTKLIFPGKEDQSDGEHHSDHHAVSHPAHHSSEIHTDTPRSRKKSDVHADSGSETSEESVPIVPVEKPVSLVKQYREVIRISNLRSKYLAEKVAQSSEPLVSSTPEPLVSSTPEPNIPDLDDIFVPQKSTRRFTVKKESYSASKMRGKFMEISDEEQSVKEHSLHISHPPHHQSTPIHPSTDGRKHHCNSSKLREKFVQECDVQEPQNSPASTRKKKSRGRNGLTTSQEMRKKFLEDQ